MSGKFVSQRSYTPIPERVDMTPLRSSSVKATLLKACLFGGVLLGLGYGGYKGGLIGGGGKKLDSGLRPAPAFKLQNSSGKEVSLRDFKDQVVVVHFWAAWCPPCIPELPEVLAAAKKLPKDSDGKDIIWLLISQDETWEQAKKILDESTLPQNVVSVIDPKAKLSGDFGTYQFPETYVLARDHGIAAKWIGPQEWTGEWGAKALQGLDSLSRTGKLTAN